MPFFISQRFLLSTVLLVFFALPFGVFAGVKEGSDENFSWKITWPTSIQVNVPAPIKIEANSPNLMFGVSCVPSLPFGQSCGEVSFCTVTCLPQWSTTGPANFLIRLSDRATPVRNNTEINLPLYICGGTICFENPLETLTFWQLFNRVIGFALLAGLAIGPIFLLYGFFRFMTSAGDAKKVSDATQIIKYTLVGIVILLLARGIMALIINLVLG